MTSWVAVSLAGEIRSVYHVILNLSATDGTLKDSDSEPNRQRYTTPIA
jgi:hypothetical protein